MNVKENQKYSRSYIKSSCKTRDKLYDLMQDNGALTVNNKKKVDILNRFFSSVFTRESIVNVPALHIPDRQVDNVLENIIVSPEEVLKKFSKLNPSKAAGPESLHCKFLFELKDLLCKPLARFSTGHLKKGEVPDQWHQAHISPIFKKGDKKQAENYRPASLTYVECKVLESLVRDNYFKLNVSHGE